MNFILIANYLPDQQESMIRYAFGLGDNLKKQGVEVVIWHPEVIFGKIANSTTSGFGKWLGYIDKFIIAPIHLIFLVVFKWNRNTIIHICDHSNSPYLKYLPRKRSGITCHDVLAIRGALGYDDAYCPASRTGVFFQKWILKNLKKAKYLTTVSQLTMNQLCSLVDKPKDSKWSVIHNSFNADFYPMSLEDRIFALKKLRLPIEIPFILHVGSSLPRKNRSMLLRMANTLESWSGNIVYTGTKGDEQLINQVNSLDLSKRVYFMERPDHDTLLALYSHCFAFVLPSFSEGFGWPLIEAQACGAPVIASDIEPLPEVSNGTAIHANPKNPEDFAHALNKLITNEAFRKRVIEEGYVNCTRFNKKLITKKFIDLYAR